MIAFDAQFQSDFLLHIFPSVSPSHPPKIQILATFQRKFGILKRNKKLRTFMYTNVHINILLHTFTYFTRNSHILCSNWCIIYVHVRRYTHVHYTCTYTVLLRTFFLFNLRAREEKNHFFPFTFSLLVSRK